MVTPRYFAAEASGGGGGGATSEILRRGCAGRTLKTPPIHIKAKPENHTYNVFI